jgi:hypothetical protein
LSGQFCAKVSHVIRLWRWICVPRICLKSGINVRTFGALRVRADVIAKKRSSPMNTEEILKNLEAISETANGWQSRCPAHNDSKASLSIAEDGGKTLLHCQAGCATTDVVQAMGLKMRDLFPDEGEKRTLVATYDYPDENGEFLYQMLRYRPKAFQARRPDGNGGWVYSTTGVKLVPYRLPMILRNKRVLIT